MQNHAREGGQKVSRFMFLWLTINPKRRVFNIAEWRSWYLARIIASRPQVRILLPLLSND